MSTRPRRWFVLNIYRLELTGDRIRAVGWCFCLPLSLLMRICRPLIDKSRRSMRRLACGLGAVGSSRSQGQSRAQTGGRTISLVGSALVVGNEGSTPQ